MGAKKLLSFVFSVFKLLSMYTPLNALLIFFLLHIFLYLLVKMIHFVWFLSPPRNGYNDQLTSESAPLSAPGHLNVTYSWQRLCTTNEQTAIDTI